MIVVLKNTFGVFGFLDFIFILGKMFITAEHCRRSEESKRVLSDNN